MSTTNTIFTPDQIELIKKEMSRLKMPEVVYKQVLEDLSNGNPVKSTVVSEIRRLLRNATDNENRKRLSKRKVLEAPALSVDLEALLTVLEASGVIQRSDFDKTRAALIASTEELPT